MSISLMHAFTIGQMLKEDYGWIGAVIATASY